MIRDVCALSLLLLVLGCDRANHTTEEKGAAPRTAPPSRMSRSFPADGIKKVILRSAKAETVAVTIDPTATTIDVSAAPTGGAEGYHPMDPNWRETPAAEWGLDFVTARHGDVLIVSSKKEIEYIHHRYLLDSLIIRIPTGVEVLREPRKLSGSGEPNLERSKP